jgi:hypothetical protein
MHKKVRKNTTPPLYAIQRIERKGIDIMREVGSLNKSTMENLSKRILQGLR